MDMSCIVGSSRLVVYEKDFILCFEECERKVE